MVCTTKTYHEKVQKDVAFESEYLITCIKAKRYGEIIEYCDKLKDSINELLFLEDMIEKYGM